MPRYQTRDAAAAAGLPRSRLDILISKKIFETEHRPGPGQVRLFTVSEIVRLAILDEITRLGVPAIRVAGIVKEIDLKRRDCALVVWHGFAEMRQTEAAGGGTVFIRMNGHGPPECAVLPMSEIVEFLAHPIVAGAIFVQIDTTMDRVMSRLGDLPSWT